MKYPHKIPFIFFCLLFINARCRKDIPPNPNSYAFTIDATLNNAAETINLGDTLKLEIKFPDTVTAKNYLNEVKSEKIRSLQFAFYYYSFNFVDTITRIDHYLSSSKRDYNLNDYLKIYPDPGKILREPYIINFATTPPYTTVLIIIPKRKGIYYFEVRPANAPTYKLNDKLAGVFFVHYPTNKHWDVVANNLDYKLWLQGANILAASGVENYAFRVK